MHGSEAHLHVGSSSTPPDTPFPPFFHPTGRLRIPTELPAFPYARTYRDTRPAASELLRMPDEPPRQFTLDAIHELAPQLMEASQRTIIQPRPYTPSLDKPSTDNPPALCIPPPAPLPFPTHVLQITFPVSRETTDVPIHGLVWSLKCRTLAHVHTSTYDSGYPPSPSPSPPAAPSPLQLGSTARVSSIMPLISLPIVPISIPFRTVWPVLYTYIHTGSTASLLGNLITYPIPPSPFESRPTELGAVIARLERVRRLWHDVNALEVEDEELWDTMAKAWSVLVAKLREELAEDVQPP
ncbi:hypothetical protein RTBOTA2_000651 [Rhodotorula toruloides]|uniref:Uncharacterized protein n=1 Tax=Rhodotorula toruloides TaxID=5286 RepID=A0A2T0A452_RHOTO|nr:hypothetical protein RTBOTA2_000651 [Rhodotorula toruloides]PRQ72797.1 hypothetical protein AAT19DRAFT_16721 [Rhodotorula toruloides]